MGQYYTAVLIKDDKNGEGHAECYSTWKANAGAKLMEHAYYGVPYADAVCAQLRRPTYEYNGDSFEPSRFAVVGDYYGDWDGFDALDEEYKLLCQVVWSRWGDALEKPLQVRQSPWRTYGGECSIYMLNSTKHECIKVEPDDIVNQEINPLFLLCAVGNGCGGGDYHGSDEDLCGSWAFDMVEIAELKEPPMGYKELRYDFAEEC